MSLQGSLDTIGLADVLNLLATTAKSGELEVSGEGRSGQLWFSAGQLSGFAVASSPTLVEALFQLMRVGAGRFSFTEGRQAPKPQPPSAVGPMLQEAKERLAEWRGIEAVVPSLDARVELAEEIPSEASVEPTQWRLLVAIGDGRTVKAVLDRRGLGEFDGCKAIKELVDRKLLRIVVVNGSGAGRKDAPSGVVVGPAIQVPAPAKPVGSPAPPPNGSAASSGSAAPNGSEPRPAAASPASKPLAPAERDQGAASAPSQEVGGQPQEKPASTSDGAAKPAADAKPAGAVTTSSPAAASPVAAVSASPPPAASPSAAASAVPSPAASSPAADGHAAHSSAKGTSGTDAPSQAPSGTEDTATADGATEPSEQGDGEEPLNRGMLLKFLSSVRS